MLLPIVILVAILTTGTAQRNVELDIPYADGGDQQKLDLYLPKDKNFTTVVYTYGGGWFRGSRKSATPIGEKLQSLGYVRTDS